MEFFEFVKTVGKIVCIYTDEDIDSYRNFVILSGIDTIEELETKYPKTDFFVGVCWCVGGSSGASCWGGVSEAYFNDNPPEDITPLVVEILEKLGKDDISLRTYTKEILPLISSGSYQGNGDFYGNYSSYATLALNLRKLYNVLYQNQP